MLGKRPIRIFSRNKPDHESESESESESDPEPEPEPEPILEEIQLSEEIPRIVFPVRERTPVEKAVLVIMQHIKPGVKLAVQSYFKEKNNNRNKNIPKDNKKRSDLLADEKERKVLEHNTRMLILKLSDELILDDFNRETRSAPSMEKIRKCVDEMFRKDQEWIDLRCFETERLKPGNWWMSEYTMRFFCNCRDSKADSNENECTADAIHCCSICSGSPTNEIYIHGWSNVDDFKPVVEAVETIWLVKVRERHRNRIKGLPGYYHPSKSFQPIDEEEEEEDCQSLNMNHQ